MKEELKRLIKGEDKKNPLTDSELANILKSKREIISKCRKELGIEDSRERRKPLLTAQIEKLLSQNPTLSEREITSILNERGFEISRHSVRSIKKEYESHKVDSYGNSQKSTVQKGKAFENIIGHDGYLKPFIQQAKAAMLYPPNGVHTLILGPTGVGKSELAEAMYQFSKEENMVREDSSFIVFNCADYADNPQLLMAQLFGYVKGAFTGAETEKEGLVEKAHGSILFLDEVHRLPNKGQELLFNLIDHGKFRRLGETNTEREVQVTIIAATTENPDSMLLVTFRRRIPMVIELPLLNVRPLKERLDIIKVFLNKEAYKTKNIIQVSNEAVRALLLYDCPGNIGQLRSDIQVSCARSFLNHMVAQTKMMKIGIDELPPAAKKGLLRIQTNRFETEKLIGNSDLIVHPKVIQDKVFPNEDVYTFPNEIYHYIENRYLDLQTQDMSQEVINHIIGSEMEERLEKLMKRVEDNVKPLEKKDLIKIVGIEVIHVVEKIIKVAKSRLGINVENLYYVLAVHLSTTIDRLKLGKIVKHPQLDKIQREYKKEYAVAKEMVNTIEEELDIVLTDDEAGFITMYLRMMTKEKETDEEGKIGVVVLSHGNVASAMADVANRLLGVIHAKFVEMPLDESPKSALDRAIDVSKSADEGKGVLLLVDMGSLITFGELITEKTGIKTRSLNKTNTIMVIEAVRRSILPDADLNEIADTLEEKSKYISRLVNTDETDQNESKKNRVIIAICITGQGSAQKIKELLEDVIIGYEEEVNVLLIGALAPNIKENIIDIQRKNDVITIVGTVNPNVSNIPFISLEDIVKGDGVSRLKNLMKHSGIKATDERKYIQKFKLLDLIHPSLSLLDMDSDSKEEAIFRLSKLLIENGHVKEGFVYSVLDREEIGPTFLSNKVSIPHADPSYVLKPGIALGKLRKEIEWNGRKINFIIMLALTSDCINVVEEIYDFFEAENNVKKMIEKNQFEDIMDTLRIYQGR